MIRTVLVIAMMMISGLSIGQENSEKAVENTIAKLFDGMRDKDQAALEAVFHEKAIMHTVTENGEQAALGENSVRDFVNRIAVTPAETRLDERILEYHIRVDGEMASAWTPYEFYVNDSFSHCGVNSFQLIKENGDWKITYVMDTRRKVGCR
ncbi:nuclear transport factor 2 family protein [Litoribacter ruber]|uniref:nuclear transport factor 2 family protein n=1 Tax=Litoribacter ruber TaxID=702568 RepID=UPI001FE3E800|nr:nuclear transport factor 2 family protein [Litoribacter ruber]